MLSKQVRATRVAAAFVVGALIAGVGVWAQNAALVGVGYDDAIYTLLARAWSQGEGYRLTYLPGALPGIKYPPIYPLSLIPFWSLAGSQEAALHAMKLANGLYIGVAAGLFAFILADLGILSVQLAGAVALFGFASGSMMLVSTSLLSEPLYLVLLCAALWQADSLGDNASRRHVLAAGALAGIVVLTRTVGIALPVAVVIGIWRRFGRKRALYAAAAAALVIAPWAIFGIHGAGQIPGPLQPRYGSYLQLYLLSLAGSPMAALQVVVINVGAILQTIGSKLVPQFGGFFQSLLGALVIVLAMLGSRRILSVAPATAIYPWVYLGVVSVWSFPPFRFVFLIFPFLLALAAVSLPVLADRFAAAAGRYGESRATMRGPWVRRAIIAVGLLVAINLGYVQARSLVRRVWDGAQLQKSTVSEEVIAWVNAHTDPGAVVAFEFEPMLALYTGRLTVPNNYEPAHFRYRRGSPPVEPLAQLLRETRADFVAVRRDVVAAAGPIDALVGRYPGSLKLVHVTPSGALIFETNLKALAGRRPARGRIERDRPGQLDLTQGSKD